MKENIQRLETLINHCENIDLVSIALRTVYSYGPERASTTTAPCRIGMTRA